MTTHNISTEHAPAAIGPYAQAVRAGDTVYLSGQIGLVPETMCLQDGMEAQLRQVFSNLSAVTVAAGGSLANIVKLTIYVTDLADFALVNKIMDEVFSAPYPARATVGVSALPKNALIEADAIMVL